MDVSIPGEFMCLIKGLIPPDLCRNIIDLYHKDSAKEAGTAVSAYGDVVQNTAKISTDLEMKPQGVWLPVHHEFHVKISEAILAISAQFAPLQGRPLQWSSYRIQHYKKGEGRFQWHYDAAAPGTFDRQLAMVIYLNTVKDGGETSFFFQKQKIKPEAGAGLFFPTFWTHMHCGEIPLSEDKYIISSFVTFKTAATETKKSA